MFAIFERFQRSKKPVVVKKDFGKNFINSLFYLLALCVLHVIAMTLLESLSIGDSIWLTLTTITTVGYGDISPGSLLGRTTTVLLLYLGGIFVFAKTAGDYFDYRAIKHQKQLKGEWRWNMNHHIVIISNHDTPVPTQYYERLAKEFRQVPQYQNSDIQILTNNFPDGLPESIQFLSVVHYQGDGNTPEDLAAVNIEQADTIIVLAKMDEDPLSDGNTFDILHRVRDVNQTALILVECVSEANRKRLEKAGASMIIRPVRAYPEMVVSALCAPGSEKLIEDMFDYEGDKYQRFDVAVKEKVWAEVVYQLMKTGIGTAVAYVSHDNEVRSNPEGKEKVDAKALLMMVREDQNCTNKDIEALLAKV